MNLILNIDNLNNNEIRLRNKGDEMNYIKIQPLDSEKESHFDFDDCYIDIFKNIEKIQNIISHNITIKYPNNKKSNSQSKKLFNM